MSEIAQSIEVIETVIDTTKEIIDRIDEIPKNTSEFITVVETVRDIIIDKDKKENVVNGVYAIINLVIGVLFGILFRDVKTELREIARILLASNAVLNIPICIAIYIGNNTKYKHPKIIGGFLTLSVVISLIGVVICIV